MAESIPAGGSNAQNAQPSPQMIRITSHGKMKPWIAFALNVFEEGDRPVVLHTLPASASDQASTPPVPLQEPPQPPVQAQRGALSNATTTIPRLISVAEIIKREYVKVLESKRSPRLEGLHQYNEIGCLENLGLDFGGDRLDETEKTRADEIILALSGRNHVKQKQTPYMKLTLSESPLPDLVAKGATYQPPTVRKLSKSAKARAKKRVRKAQAQGNEDTNDGISEQDTEIDDGEEIRDVDAELTTVKGKKRSRVAATDKAGS